MLSVKVLFVLSDTEKIWLLPVPKVRTLSVMVPSRLVAPSESDAPAM